jgi:hypothetical protein
VSILNKIQFKDQTIIGVHILTQVTDGNHVPYREKKTITLLTEKLDELPITEFDYDNEIVGSGIRKFTGTVERGGGRHCFYGIDIEQAKELLI